MNITTKKKLVKIAKIVAIAIVALPLMLIGCVKLAVKIYAPKPPAYPHFQDRQAVMADAQRISDQLEAYIKDWFDGKAPAELPTRLIPSGVDTNVFKHFTLRRPEDVNPERAWPARIAEQIVLNRIHAVGISFSCGLAGKSGMVFNCIAVGNRTQNLLP